MARRHKICKGQLRYQADLERALSRAMKRAADEEQTYLVITTPFFTTARTYRIAVIREGSRPLLWGEHVAYRVRYAPPLNQVDKTMVVT